MHIDYDSEDELEMHKGIMGSRALSHDSIFIPDTTQEPPRPGRVFSQENVSDRIRALQLKLQQNWKLGVSSPFGMPSKRVDDAGMSSEDDGLPRSPPEASLLQEILNPCTTKFSDSHKHLSSLSLAGTGSEEEEQVTSIPLRPCSTESQLFPRQSSAKIIALQTSDCSLSPPADFDTPPEFSACLDNSAAKHKLLIKPRNQRSSKTRQPLSRNLAASQNDLRCTHEKNECEKKDLLAELTHEAGSSSHQEVIKSTVVSNNTVYFHTPQTAKGLQRNLGHQNEKVCMLHSASKLDSPCENNLEDCQTTQKLFYTTSLPSSSKSKEDTTTQNVTLAQESQKEKEHSETLKMNSGNLNGMSLGVLNQEKRQTDCMPSENDMLPDKDISTENDILPALVGTGKNVPKDAKVLMEDIYNTESPSLPNSINLLPKSPFQLTDTAYPESSNSSQSSCTSRTDEPYSLALDKMKPTHEFPVSDKENNHPAVPRMLILGWKAEKATSEPSALRKFSVSSAQGRSRASSMNVKDNSKCESPLNMQILQSKIKNPSRNEYLKDDAQVNSSQERKNRSNQQASESEIAERTLERTVVGLLSQAGSSKPVLSNFGSGLPQQSNAGQSSCEDRSPFQGKLRSTSLSVKYRDNSSEESKELKRYSAEFNLEKGLPSLKDEKAEIRKTTDIPISDFLNESLKTKTKSSEQCSTKPPLPRKPILQHFIITGTINTSLEKQEKRTKYPELKNEDYDLEKKTRPSELPEKSVPSPVVTADAIRGTETQTTPTWITIAKQKQRGTEKELSREEKPVAQDKADAEKQTKEERVEEVVRQQRDFTRNTISPLPPTVPSEEQKKETKPDTQESLTRGGLLSHHSPVSTEKEAIKPVKKIGHSSPDQPSWMELAKKKSQAWSDMPQMIK
ncbi:CRACD-like protein isoform X2 [Hemicordylus capensis]|nr:CRACD-like protein isoform X2 [Hemicordylus capensis]XP_053161670.1 CRACD-like protein isoform X2 [Hemicordylus capensis]